MVFFVGGVKRYAVYWADLLTLRLVVVANALCTFVGVNNIDLFTLGDGLIGALRFAYIAVDAIVSND